MTKLSMSPGQVSHKTQKSQLSGTAVVAVVEVVGVEDNVVKGVEEVKEGAKVLTEVKEIKEEEEIIIKDKEEDKEEEVKVKVTVDIKPRDMLIFPHLRPVSAIGRTGSRLISAWSRAPAPGRTSGPPKPTIEGPASPTRRQLRQ